MLVGRPRYDQRYNRGLIFSGGEPTMVVVLVVGCLRRRRRRVVVERVLCLRARLLIRHSLYTPYKGSHDSTGEVLFDRSCIQGIYSHRG